MYARRFRPRYFAASTTETVDRPCHDCDSANVWGLPTWSMHVCWAVSGVAPVKWEGGQASQTLRCTHNKGARNDLDEPYSHSCLPAALFIFEDMEDAYAGIVYTHIVVRTFKYQQHLQHQYNWHPIMLSGTMPFK